MTFSCGFVWICWTLLFFQVNKNFHATNFVRINVSFIIIITSTIPSPQQPVSHRSSIIYASSFHLASVSLTLAVSLFISINIWIHRKSKNYGNAVVCIWHQWLFCIIGMCNMKSRPCWVSRLLWGFMCICCCDYPVSVFVVRCKATTTTFTSFV